MQTLCKKTFSATKDTAFYRIHKPQEELVLMVLTLLAHGCPLQAIVAAFGLDGRTAWPAGKERPERSAKGCMSTW